MKFDFEKAKARYNKIMNYCCLEYLTIGESLSEDTEGWNIRDMVAECDFQLNGSYLDPSTMTGDMRHSEDEHERKMWQSAVGKLKRFIKAYEPFIEGVKCKQGHCSKYDN